MNERPPEAMPVAGDRCEAVWASFQKGQPSESKETSVSERGHWRFYEYTPNLPPKLPPDAVVRRGTLRAVHRRES
jgi:hypothetical protein